MSDPGFVWRKTGGYLYMDFATTNGWLRWAPGWLARILWRCECAGRSVFVCSLWRRHHQICRPNEWISSHKWNECQECCRRFG